MRKLNTTLLATGGILTLLLTGCQGGMKSPVQRLGNTPPEETTATPLTVDPAMQIRDWNRSTALYANGDTIAGPTGFRYQPNEQQPTWAYIATELPLFVVQTALLPVNVVLAPPWTDVRYTGVTVDPTYTAMPVLPPSQNVEHHPVIQEANQPPATQQP